MHTLLYVVILTVTFVCAAPPAAMADQAGRPGPGCSGGGEEAERL